MANWGMLWEDDKLVSFVNKNFHLMLSTFGLATLVAVFLLVFVIPTTRAWLWYPKANARDSYLPKSDLDEASQKKLIAFNQKGAQATHFCFLLHGHRGFSRDLSYLQAVMQLLVDREKLKLADQPTKIRQDMIVHSPVCNEHKTTDGVVNGGVRLVDEMETFIRRTMSEKPVSTGKDVTISVVGNSLGGVYGRYAIAHISDRFTDSEYNLHFNIFCTTATPHLGISKHTWIPVPRSAEIGIATTMGDTGKDLFRLNDLMKSMATTSKFLDPLGKFRKRIAYANAYGTDFPVPTQTAAFLSKKSSYPHHFVEEDSDSENENRVVVDDNGLVIATLQTPAGYIPGKGAILDKENTDDLDQMSNALDSLGWKKVFVDVRNEIPMQFTIPKIISKQSSGGDSTPVNEPVQSLKEKGIVESRDIAEAISLPPKMDKITVPLGHNMIVAFSRNKVSALMNKSGRPVVNALAKELVEDIFRWGEELSK